MNWLTTIFTLKIKIHSLLKQGIRHIKKRNDKQIIGLLILLLVVENTWKYLGGFNIDFFNSLIKYLIAFPLYSAYVIIGEIKKEISIFHQLVKRIDEIEKRLIKYQRELRILKVRINELKRSNDKAKERLFIELGKQDITIEDIRKKAKDLSLIKILMDENTKKIKEFEERLNQF